MTKELLFTMPSPFRDTFRIHGYRFGKGQKSLAIVGAMRGDEIHQQYICSQLVRKLAQTEERGNLAPGHEILVIPSANPFSMNIGKRFWAMDSTDINRMFPGYDQGETTQRIAAALFEHIKDYSYGVQLASFYIPGDFIPHVRMIQTGYEDRDTANLFGLPYVYLRQPLPFDTTLLNYNWQIWGTKAFSIYGGQNNEVQGTTTTDIINTLLHFMKRIGLTKRSPSAHPDYRSQLIGDRDLTDLKAPAAGILYKVKNARDEVRRGDLLARIIDPYEGNVLAEVQAPDDGIVFFAHNQSLVLENTLLYKLHV